MTLIANYGTKLNPASLSWQWADSLRRDLDDMGYWVKNVKNKRAQSILQRYLADCRGVYLLSINPNLNENAFAEVLVSLNKSRAQLRTVIARQPTK